MQKTSLHGASINNRYVSNILHYYVHHTYINTYDDDDQPKLRGSGVVVTLVCEYTRDPFLVFIQSSFWIIHTVKHKIGFLY